MAEPEWPAQEAHRVRPRGREATRPRGHLCGAPRVGLVIEGTETKLIGESTPLFNYVPHVLPFASDVDARQASDFIKTVKIVWTRVHAIFIKACA